MIDSDAHVSAQLQESTPRNEEGLRALVAVASLRAGDAESTGDAQPGLVPAVSEKWGASGATKGYGFRENDV